MKGLRHIVVVGALGAAVAVSGCDGKGSRGKAGPVGPAAPAPVLLGLSFPSITHNLVLTAYGQNFAQVVTDASAAPSVWVNGWKADVLSSDATSITFTHGVPANWQNYDTYVNVVVEVNNLVSNPSQVYVDYPGDTYDVDQTFFYDGHALTMAANGDLINVDDGFLDRIDPTGTIRNVPLQFSTNGVTKAWDDGASGYYALDNSGHLDRYAADGSAVRLANIPGAYDGAWDNANPPNFYALYDNGRTLIAKFDGTTKAVTLPFATPDNAGNAFYANAVTRMGTALYLTDTTYDAVVAVDIGTQASTVYAANASIAGPIVGLANDGTNLYLSAGGDITKIDGTGTPSQYSALHADNAGGYIQGIAVDAAGHVFVSSNNGYEGSYIVRYSNAGASIEPWATSATGSAFILENGRLFDGSMNPRTAGSPDVATGVLYEYMGDGSLRRVTGQLQNWDTYRPFNGYPFLYGWLTLHAGKLWAVDFDTGVVTSIDPDSGAVTTFFDNSNGDLDSPTTIAFDASGNAYVPHYSDGDDFYAVAKIDSTGTLVTPNFAASPDDTEMRGIAVQGSRLVVADSDSYRLWTAPLSGTAGQLGVILGDPANTGDTSLSIAVNGGMYTDPATGNVVFEALEDSYYDYYGQMNELTPSDDLLVPIDYTYSEFAVLDPSGVAIGISFGNHTLVIP